MSKLEVVCGPMFAGKTEELIRRVKRATIANQKVAVFKPDIDHRYGTNKMVSHSKTDLELATGIRPIPIPTKGYVIYTPNHPDLSLVAFDEAQFFDWDWLNELIDILQDEGIRVICAGLDLDSFGKPFGSMPMLLAKADEVVKLKAVCTACGDDASRTHRKVESQEVNFVGGAEAYEPLCANCWLDKNLGRP